MMGNTDEQGGSEWSAIQGMSLPEAAAFVHSSGMRLRSVVVDGKPLMVTCDYDPTRINVEVSGDRIVGVVGIG